VHQARAWAVEVVPATEAAGGEEIALDVVKRALHPGAAVGIANGVGAKLKAEDLPKGRHLRGDLGLRAAARGHHHVGVIDHTAPGTAIHKDQGLTQKCLGLEAGETGVILDKEPTRIGQHHRGALGRDAALTQGETMRGGIELHLLARGEVIAPGALFGRT